MEERLATETARVLVTRRGLDWKKKESRDEVVRVLDRPVVRAEQVHGAVVATVEGAGEPIPGADGLATRSRAALVALGADCPGVAILGVTSVAVAHSGWRGAVADVAPLAAQRLIEWGERPGRLKAFVGPGIGRCCFEVGDEVVAAFEAAHGPLRGLVERRGKAHIDLKGAIARRLVERAGLRPENVLVAPECTRCSPAFFSRRREGAGCGHHGVLAFLK